MGMRVGPTSHMRLQVARHAAMDRVMRPSRREECARRWRGGGGGRRAEGGHAEAFSKTPSTTSPSMDRRRRKITNPHVTATKMITEVVS